MPVTSKNLKKVNITVVFEQQQAPPPRGDFDTVLGAEEAGRASFLETPSFRAMIAPLRHKEIVFEKNRLVVSDISGIQDNFSDLAQVFSNALGLTPNRAIKAFGFNFTIELHLDAFQIRELVPQNLLTAIGQSDITQAANFLVFQDQGKKITLTVSPNDESTNILILDSNIHYQTNNVPSNELVSKVSADYQYFLGLIDRIFSP